MNEDKKNDEMISSLRGAERARRTRTMIIAAIIATVGIGAVVVSVMFSDAMFQPEMDVESGEESVLADTNDPQCRAFIATVTEIGRDYQALEPRLQGELLADDRGAIEGDLADLEALRERLVEAEKLAGDAELRFDTSRREIEDWFRYVKNELRLLHIVGSEHLATLEPADGPDAGTAGTVVADPKRPKPASTKTPQERLDGATLAANEAFQKFRVWHTGSLHPCGKAGEGETPWTAPADPAQP